MDHLILKIQFAFLSILFFCNSITAQVQGARTFDVLNYQFDVRLEDSTDVIRASAQIKVALNGSREIILDLVNQENTGQKGMRVESVLLNGVDVQFIHENKLLTIKPIQVNATDTANLQIKYTGIPINGLIIAKNKFNERTFFADHWPNRASNWLPVVDHPMEKASCQFSVTAPEKYDVIANGDWMGVISNKGYKTTIWKEENPIPAKVMVIGVADFETKVLDNDSLITAWVYTQDVDNGFRDFEDTPGIYEFIASILGEYPFTKLDQVQSKTRYGGMENAGNIFYPENRIDGSKSFNATIAHEIAHQWFGNSVSESDWEHVWISEGFATFMTYWYIHDSYGLDSLKNVFERDTRRIEQYQLENPAATILQSNYNDVNDVLNPLTYQKAGRLLWMFKHEIGDEKMIDVLRTFHSTYKYGNASSQDFIKVVNDVTGRDFSAYFNGWLTGVNLIDLRYSWKYKKGNLEFSIVQKSSQPFQFQLDLGIKYTRMTFDVHKVNVTKSTQTFTIETDGKPLELDVDPLDVILGNIR